MVLTNEKHNWNCTGLFLAAGEEADLQCPFKLLLNDYQFLPQHVFQSNLQVSSKGRPKPSDSKIL